MQVIRHKAILCILGGLIYLVLASHVAGQEPSVLFSLSEKPSISNENKGYRDIVAYKDQFLAVGTDGRIDCINKSGEITRINNALKNNLNGVIYTNQTIIAVGNEGTILFSSDGKTFLKNESETDKNINSITSFKGHLVASADDGTILVMESGNSWTQIQFQLKGDIVSISSGSSLCIGVTNKGEMIKTSDAINWDIFDYNEEYAGYNKPCSFKEVLITLNRIAIIGQHEDGSPVVLFSSLGNVWTERSVNYIDEHGMMQVVTNQPNDICYDAAGDQFFLVCNNGEVLILPSCTKCNKSFIVNEYNLNGIICLENTIMIVGDDYFVNVVEH